MIYSILTKYWYRFIEVSLGIKFINLDRHKTYSDYVRKQKEKTLNPTKVQKWLGEEWDTKLNGFLQVFERNRDFIELSTTAVCLGSRTGQEVKALQNLGLDAVGVDLVEFPPLTIFGDIHDLKFDNQSFDLVFSNIFDHSLYPENFISEIERVCKFKGFVILNLQLYAKGDDYAENIILSPEYVCSLFKISELVISRPIKNEVDGMNWEIVMQKMG